MGRQRQTNRHLGRDPDYRWCRTVTGVIGLSGAIYREHLRARAGAASGSVVAFPLAAGELAWAGTTRSPAIGAVLSGLATIVVALNAEILLRLDLRPWSLGMLCYYSASVMIGSPASTAAARWR